ncbi:hypothetical protein [Lentzea sp. NPDC059081]|uniref:hypothetical protein n=1 Tax=Lentzea sp. NPDC059081 TaxID=3346719 RepID=UPI00367BCDEB
MRRLVEQEVLGGFVVARLGRHLQVRHRSEPEPRPAASLPVVPGLTFVLFSGRASGDGVVEHLPHLLRPLAEEAGAATPVLVLDSGEAAARYLARELGREVLGSGGAVVCGPGGFHACAGGWWAFRPGASPRLVGARLPAPRWESQVLATAVSSGGVVVEPVPAGVLVRSATAKPADAAHPAFAVPRDNTRPKVVVDGTEPVPGPGAVASVLTSLVPANAVLVASTPEVTTSSWQLELALAAGRAVEFVPGRQEVAGNGAIAAVATGEVAFHPFPALLRQPAGTGDQVVVESAPPPRGWVRQGACAYRPSTGADFVAQVVPSGLVVRSASAAPVVPPLPFDPSYWNLYLGTRDEPAGLALLAVAEQLIAGLEPAQRAVVRVRVPGGLDDQASAALRRARSLVGRDPVPPEPAVPEVAARPRPDAEPQVAVRSRPAPEPEAVAGPAVQRVAEPAVAPVTPVPAAPPPAAAPPSGFAFSAPPMIMTTSAPVPVVSEPVSPESELVVLDPAAPGPEAAPVPEPELPEIEVSPAAEMAAAAGPDSGPVTEPADLVVEPGEGVPAQDVPPPANASPLSIADRNSTAAEQSRFALMAGEAFTESLATVNSAMANWPSLRQGESAGLKADYVAVCLFLGRGELAGAAVGDAVRAGRQPSVEGFLPCLVSGVRRLPVHRGPVLRQALKAEALEYRSSTGTVLTEPGVLIAATSLDVTHVDAELDVLIWPATARRTADLVASRSLAEAVFAPAARFKKLAVRTLEADAEHEGPAAPRIAVLFRELAPEEGEVAEELDQRDEAALGKLDRALARRQRTALRVVEDPELVARLTGSMIEWHAPAAADRTAAAS